MKFRSENVDWLYEAELMWHGDFDPESKQYKRKVRSLGQNVPPDNVIADVRAMEQRIEKGLAYVTENEWDISGRNFWDHLLRAHSLAYFVARYQKAMLGTVPGWSPWNTVAQNEAVATLDELKTPEQLALA